MGYILKSLHSLEMSDKYKHYVFFLTCEHSTLLEDLMDRYFLTITKGLRGKALIVKGFEAGQLHKDFVEFYKKHCLSDQALEREVDWACYGEFIDFLPEHIQYRPILAIVSTDAEKGADIFPWRFISLERIATEEQFVRVMDVVTNAIASDKLHDLDSLSIRSKKHASKSGLIRFTLIEALSIISGSVEVKPGMFGVSIDLKKIWQRIIDRDS